MNVPDGLAHPWNRFVEATCMMHIAFLRDPDLDCVLINLRQVTGSRKGSSGGRAAERFLHKTRTVIHRNEVETTHGLARHCACAV